MARGKRHRPSDAQASEGAVDSQDQGADDLDIEVDEAPVAAPSAPAATAAPVPALQPKAMRPGLVRVRALRSVVVAGMPYEAGELIVCHESHATSRLKRGEIERA